jgi:hypothetical protein
MKALEQFAKENNLLVIPIKYTFQGISVKRKGFDLCKKDGSILMTFEPVSFVFCKDKYLLCNYFEDCKLPLGSYLKRITYKWLKENINPSANSSYKNSTV